MAIDTLWSNVSLLLPFSSDLLDVKGHIVTANGGAVLSSSVGNPFGAGNACYFDGTNDYLALADSADWAVGTGDFIIDGWVYPTSFPGGGVSNDMCLINIPGSPQFFFYIDNTTGKPILWNGTTGYTGANALTINAWNYVWAKRASSTLTIGIGTTTGITQASYTTNFAAYTGVTVGGLTASRYLHGYLSNLRLTKASRTIVLPTTPHPRPTISGHIYDAAAAPVAKTILVHDRSTQTYLGGANSDPSTGAYTFYPPDFGEVTVTRLDELAEPYWSAVLFASRLSASGFPTLTGQTTTATGTVTADTAVADPFGGATPCALFTGDTSRLLVSGSVTIGATFTIKGWLRITTLTSPESAIFFLGTFGSNANRIQIEILSTGAIEFYSTNASVVFDAVSAAGTISTGTWYHFATVCDGTNARLFVDGSLVASAAMAGVPTPGTSLYLGYCRSASTTRGLVGRLSDVRVSNRAEYSAAFTPPTIPFLVAPTDGGSGENAIIYDRVIPGSP